MARFSRGPEGIQVGREETKVEGEENTAWGPVGCFERVGTGSGNLSGNDHCMYAWNALTVCVALALLWSQSLCCCAFNHFTTRLMRQDRARSAERRHKPEPEPETAQQTESGCDSLGRPRLQAA